MNPVQRLLSFFTEAANRKLLEPAGGTKKRGKPSSHPRWPARGSGAKRKRKQKMQRRARRVNRR